MRAQTHRSLDGLSREELLEAAKGEPIELLIVGAGATGLGAALEGALSGYRTLVLERADVGSGTSSKSTKLIHGGLRYLKQGHVGLVREGLLERGRLLANAAHLVQPRPMVATARTVLERTMARIGILAYDALAGSRRLGWSSGLSRAQLEATVPGVAKGRFAGAVRFFDGQFDDARLLVALLRSALALGAPVLTRMEVTGLLRTAAGTLYGVRAVDRETGTEHEIAAKVVVNAAGPFGDGLRRADRPDVHNLLAPSSGAHVVLPREFLPGSTGVFVPTTDDGRVLFVLPYWDKVLVGTTDVPAPTVPAEPRASEDEIQFVLDSAAQVLARAPTRADVLSTWSGLRPLVAGAGASSARLSRDFTIEVAPSGLVTIAGGKWTGYRAMGAALLERVRRIIGPPAEESTGADSKQFALHGSFGPAPLGGTLGPFGNGDRLDHYGSDREAVRALCQSRKDLAQPVHPRLELLGGEVLWFARHELARTPADALARRSRALLLDSAAALEAGPRVCELLAEELGHGPAWIEGALADLAREAATFGR